MFRLVLFIAVLAVPALAQDSAAIKDVLKKEVRGIKLLRHFYANPELQFSRTESGLIPIGPVPRFWSTDGFIKIESAKLRGDVVEIKAESLTLIFDRKKSEVKFKGYARRRITFPVSSADDALQAVRQIFVTPTEDLATMVPPEWRRFVSTHRIGDFPARELEPFSEKHAKDPSVVRPQPIYQTEPSFSNIARALKYQGQTAVQAEIDENGVVKKIVILTPAGAGLDEEAVSAIQTWRFKPAMKEGKPVSYPIAVEMDFNLGTWF